MAFSAPRSEILTIIILSVTLMILQKNQYDDLTTKRLKSNNTYIEYKSLAKAEMKENITILIWSNYFNRTFGTMEYTDLLKQLMRNMPCKGWCHVTGDKSYFNQSDALVWHGWRDDPITLDVPEKRNLQQPWVWWAMECPYYSGVDQLHKHKNVFNWTMTYRLDSDVLYTYGSAIPIQNSNYSRSISDPRTHDSLPSTVAVISTCHTPGKRENLIKALRQAGLAIDMYGRCGKPVATSNTTTFWKELAFRYKFYLAFENSDCLDYITEKFWRALDLGILPVVYGGGNYSQVAPPHSFINVEDFDSAKSLVRHLEYLSETPLEYNKYFEWKHNFKIRDGSTDGNGWCTLCMKLKAKDHLKTVSIHKDVASWYTTGGNLGLSACAKPEDNNFWANLSNFKLLQQNYL